MANQRTITRTWKKTRFNEYFVIDGDRHVVEPPETFTSFLEPAYRKQACVVLYVFVKVVYLPLPKGVGIFEELTVTLYRLLGIF